MDQKAWLWRKRISQKTILNGNSGLHSEANVDNEVQSLPSEKEVALEQSVNRLNEKLASLLSECNAKEELAMSYEKQTQEAIEGKEKAERELQSSRIHLDEALQQKFEANERNKSLNSALKDCMQQLASTKNEQDQSVHVAVMRASKELDKSHKKLEDNLSETGKKVTNLMVENARLADSLLAKENMLKDLSNRKALVEAEFSGLVSRLDYVEKENAFMKYELRMLEKDLDIRNEEIQFNRHSVESLQKQQLEKVKKIKKLEAECQRLRVLLRKRLPGPSMLANMNMEIELQRTHQIEMRRASLGQVVRPSRSTREDFDVSNKRINFLVERLQYMEKENKILRDTLCNKDNASCCSISELLQREPLPGGVHMSQEPVEKALSNTVSNECSSISGSNIYDEMDTNSSRSWASALVLQVDNFKDAESNNTPRHNKMGISEMNLMDDFVEMEKLAIVAIDHVKQESVNKDLCLNHVDTTGKELVPVGKAHLGVDEDLAISKLSSREHCDWLQTVLKAINEQIQASERTADEILEDIKVALDGEASKAVNSQHLQPVSGYITWKSPSPSPRVNSHHQVPIVASPMEEEKRHESIRYLSQSISDIIELVRKFGSTNLDDSIPDTKRFDSKSKDYIIRVFGWKSADLISVLEQFIDTCNHFSDGQVDLEKFAAELLSATGWILRNYSTEQESAQSLLLEMENEQRALEIENKGLKAEVKELKTLQHELELSVKSARNETESLSTELQQSHESIKSLQAELEMLRESKQMIEDQFENTKMMIEDTESELNLTKSKLNDISQKFSSLEVELEDKSHSCQELEGMCLELQLHLESTTTKEIMKEDNMNPDRKLLQTGWEITAASAKLAECEAAILNLGSQLKGLTPSNRTTCRNNVLYSHEKSFKKLDRRISLLDQMLSEEGDNVKGMKSLSATEGQKQLTLEGNHQNALSSSSDQQESIEAYLGTKGKDGNGAATAGALVVIPGKKRRGRFTFLRKLLLTRDQSNRKKTPFTFTV